MYRGSAETQGMCLSLTRFSHESTSDDGPVAGLVLVDGRERRAHAQVTGRASKYPPTHWVYHIVSNLTEQQQVTE